MEITALKQCNKHLISMLQREHFNETCNLLKILTLRVSIKSGFHLFFHLLDTLRNILLELCIVQNLDVMKKS